MKWLSVGVLVLVVAALFVFSAVAADRRFGPDPEPTVSRSPSAAPLRPEPAPTQDDRFRLPSRPTVLFSGDSLADGWHATTENRGFRAIISATIVKNRPDARFVEAHKAGFTLQMVVDRFPIPSSVDLAVVELGTNDVNGTEKTPPSTFQKQYSEYLRAIMTKNPKSGLICLGTFASANEASNAIDAVISRVCRQYGGSYIDLTATFADEAMRGPEGRRTWAGAADMGHPNDAGHRKVAAMVLALVDPK
jgi:lysophospholipase L1-like esterase